MFVMRSVALEQAGADAPKVLAAWQLNPVCRGLVDSKNLATLPRPELNTTSAPVGGKSSFLLVECLLH